MSPGPQDRDGPLQSMGAYKRWLDRYLGETFGVVPMHRISGTLNSSQIGGEPSDGDVPAADSSAEGRGVKWTAPADTPFATDADLAAHETDTTSVHGIDDTDQIAFKDQANTFVQPVTVDRVGNGDVLVLKVGGVERGLVRVVGGELSIVTPFDTPLTLGGGNGLTLSGGVGLISTDGARITDVDDGTDPTDAVTKSQLDTKQTLDTLLTNIAALSMIDNRIIVGTGADTVELWTVTDFVKTLLDDADAATARTTLGSAGTAAANTFTKKQIIAPDSDTQALDVRRGTDSSPTASIVRVRDAADTLDILSVGPTGTLRVKPTADVNVLDLTRGTDTAPTTNLIRARNNAQSVTIFSVDANGKVFGTGLDAGSQRVTAVADATAATDAATKGQLDTGLATKLPKTTDANGTVWNPQGQALAAPTSTAAGIGNRLRYCTVVVPQKCTATGLRYKVGSTSLGNVTAALLTAAAQVAAPATAIAQAAVNTRQEVPFNAPVVIEPGVYTAMLRLTGDTGTAFCWAAADFLGPAGESSGGMPATQAPPTGLTAVPVPALTLY